MPKSIFYPSYYSSISFQTTQWLQRDYGLCFGFRGLLEEDGLRWESEVARLDRPVKSDGERGVVKQSTWIGLSH